MIATVTRRAIFDALRVLTAPGPPDDVVREFEQLIGEEFDATVARIVALLPDDPPSDDAKYSPDQPREDNGQFGEGSGGGSGTDAAGAGGVSISAAPKGQRALGEGPTGGKISKLETKDISEGVAVAYMRKQGWANAQRLEVAGGRNNLPIDVVYDHSAVEVKGGLSSNRADARKWRLTIGEPGEAEKAWLKTASPAAKLKWNADKSARIVARKKQMVAALSKAKGYPVKLQTVTAVVNPSKKLVDLHVFEGVHPSIRWGSAEAKAGYVGTFRYRTAGKKSYGEIDVDALLARIFAGMRFEVAA